MIDRRHYGIIAFPTSQAAAAAEATVLAAGYLCRLIPMPEQISAGCGLVLQTRLEELAEIRSLLSKHNVSLDGFYEASFENRKKFVTEWEG